MARMILLGFVLNLHSSCLEYGKEGTVKCEWQGTGYAREEAGEESLTACFNLCKGEWLLECLTGRVALRTDLWFTGTILSEPLYDCFWRKAKEIREVFEDNVCFGDQFWRLSQINTSRTQCYNKRKL